MKLLALLFLATVAQLGAGRDDLTEPAVGRREALNIGHDASPIDTAVLLPQSPNNGCTTTVSTTYSYPCSWDGTTTVYTSTTVLYKQINCNGCDSVSVYEEWYYCPNQPVTATLNAGFPTTSWSTICQPSPALPDRAQAKKPATTTALGLGAPQTVRSPPSFPTGNPFPTPTIEPGPRRARGRAGHF
ncbi:hypothetical protein L209DRAFT_762890 [Thermothelomyces heterothallicus CBS 203.75]